MPDEKSQHIARHFVKNENRKGIKAAGNPGMDNVVAPDQTPGQGGCHESSRPDQAAVPRQKSQLP
jgi:hypothetical protein